jgi:hypothetical protein
MRANIRDECAFAPKHHQFNIATGPPPTPESLRQTLTAWRRAKEKAVADGAVDRYLIRRDRATRRR